MNQSSQKRVSRLGMCIIVLMVSSVIGLSGEILGNAIFRSKTEPDDPKLSLDGSSVREAGSLLNTKNDFHQAQEESRLNDAWKNAISAFSKIVEPKLEHLRLKLGDPDADYVEVQHDLFRKYIPNYKVFSQNSNKVLQGTTCTFLLNQDGTIVDLGNTLLKGKNNEYRVVGIAKFLKSLKIRVTNKEQAIEVAQFFNELRNAKSFASSIRSNTKNFKLFDKSALSRANQSEKNWKYSAIQLNADWNVDVRYVGPPSSIKRPPSYRIKIDMKRLLVDIYLDYQSQ